MEPRIQYAQTKDGVSIAFCALGEGGQAPAEATGAAAQAVTTWPATEL